MMVASGGYEEQDYFCTPTKVRCHIQLCTENKEEDALSSGDVNRYSLDFSLYGRIHDLPILFSDIRLHDNTTLVFFTGGDFRFDAHSPHPAYLQRATLNRRC